MHIVEPTPDALLLAGPGTTLSTLLSNLPGAAYQCAVDAPWTISYISPGVHALTGYLPKLFARGELTWAAITHPEDLPVLTKVVDEAVGAKQPFSVSYRIRCAGGQEKWVCERGEAIYSANGEPTSIVGFICDITQQMRAEENLREVEDHYKWTMKLNEHLSWTADAKGAATEVSDKFLESTGMLREEALGEGWMEAVHPDDQEAASTIWLEAASSGAPIDQRTRLKQASGEYRWSRTRGAPIKDSDGAIEKWRGTTEDIDDQVQAELKLATAQARLAHLSRDKVMHILAATLAHEINQPLAAASNYLEGTASLVAQSRETGNTRIKEGLQAAAQQIIRAGEVIRRVRSLVQQKQPRKDVIALNSLIDGVMKMMEASQACPDLSLAVSIQQRAREIVGDQILMEQVLLNLFSNACHAMSHLPSPVIEVSAEMEGLNAVKVTIKDRGTGLSEQAKASLFVAYGYSSGDGLGAGLSISRTIIDAHGGSIWAENNPDVGTSFIFTVPIAPVAKQRTKAERRAP